MRCNACDVDLNENVSYCPLCGGPVRDIPPLIEGIVFQEYPNYRREKPALIRSRGEIITRHRRSMPLREELKARFHF